MLCRIYRWKLARHLAGGEADPAGARRHLEACPACRQWYQRLEEIRRALRDEAPPVEAMPGGLAERIMAAVREEGAVPTHVPAPRSRRVILLRPGLLAAAACLVLAVGAYVVLRPVPRPPAPPPGPTARRAPLPDPEELTGALLGDVRRLAELGMTEQVRDLAERTEALGVSLLGHVPVDLLAGGDSRWLRELIPGAGSTPAAPAATTGPARPGPTGRTPRGQT